MALIGKIRENSWLLIVLLALGLGGFIVMDMTSGQQSVFGGNANTLAEIEGEKVSYQDFNSVERLFNGQNAFSQRDFVWNYFVDKALVGQEAEVLGLGVSSEELRELQFGANLSPIIESRFRDPSNFQIDRTRLNSYRDAIDNGTFDNPEQRRFWAHQEKEIKVDRLKKKIGNLVAKAIYAPTWQVEMVGAEQNSKVDFAYVQIPFDEVDNADVQLSDSDYETYLKNNAALYETEEETRKLDYVVFDVEPTQEDIDTIRAEMVRLARDFKATLNDTTFLTSNYSTFDATYKKKSELPAAIADTVWNMSVGSIYGPYEDEETNSFKVAKILNRKVIPDSVESRHILLPAKTQPEFVQAFQTLDSLKNLIEDDQATFAELAQQFGTDGTREKGGDLGFAAPGQMVPQFNNLIFYDAEPDELNIIQTQFGLHLVEVTGRKYESNEEGVQLGLISEPIVPSSKTESAINQAALKFASQHKTREELLAAVAERDDLDIETSTSLKLNDHTIGDLGSNQGARDMVKWAFASSTSVNNVSPQVFGFQDQVEFYTNKFVVVALRSIQKAGMPSVANIKDEIEAQVRNEKKVAVIQQQISSKDIAAIASQYGTSVDTTREVSFNSSFLPGLGSEPKVISKAFSAEVGSLASPVAGNNGVYVIKVLNKPENSTPPNIPQLRRTIAGGVRTQATSNIAQELRKDASIEDNRSKFY
ncbi:MAG: peptidylprolyl isomerase [Bacteroidota bacterium]